ncbi:uncharacterized protein LOC118203879, partial [Stegodyphus dumicola]|uniref:uncharacterized protein LOC118203879 n=1 Tax=Stegodyphus dumicola TaxID=202533 RepID=UPI0015ABE24F
LLGLVSCDEVCIHSELQLCYIEISNSEEFLEFCDLGSTLVQCLGAAAEKCNMEQDSNVNDFTEAIKEVCKEGSKTNEKFTEFKACFKEGSIASNECQQTNLDLVKDAGLDPEKMIYSTIEVCRRFDSIVLCVENHIKNACTVDGKNFLSKFYKPVFNIEKNYCTKLLGNRDFSFQATAWIFRYVALILLFFLLLFFCYNRRLIQSASSSKYSNLSGLKIKPSSIGSQRTFSSLC